MIVNRLNITNVTEDLDRSMAMEFQKPFAFYRSSNGDVWFLYRRRTSAQLTWIQFQTGVCYLVFTANRFRRVPAEMADVWLYRVNARHDSFTVAAQVCGFKGVLVAAHADPTAAAAP